MRCSHDADIMTGTSNGHGNVVAIIISPLTRAPFELCEPCLNEVFDWCDEHSEREPVAVQYLSGWIERTLGLLPAPPTEGP